MKKVPFAILSSTLFVFFYNLSPYLGIPDSIIFAMFLISPFIVIYMVYIVLKFGTPSKYTFEERFYDDLDYVRNTVKVSEKFIDN
jgi:hypothetical protein